MSEHTEGPWFSSGEMESDDGWPYATVGPYDSKRKPDRDHFEETIASVSGINHNAEANARLIAAAPDLLAALKGLLSPDERSVYATSGEIAAARAAVAKAEGR